MRQFTWRERGARTPASATNAVVLQAGRILLGGYAGAGGGASDFDAVVARLDNNLIFTNGFDPVPPPPPF